MIINAEFTHVLDKSLDRRIDEDGKEYIWAYATSGAAQYTVYAFTVGYDTVTGYCAYKPNSTASLTAGSYNVTQYYVGTPEYTIASGCCGWCQVAGYASDVQVGAACLTGTAGDAFSWSDDSIFANGSAYSGGFHQIGMLMQTSSASTTASVFFNGKLCCGNG